MSSADWILITHIIELAFLVVASLLAGWLQARRAQGEVHLARALKYDLQNIALWLYLKRVPPGRDRHETTWKRIIAGDCAVRLYTDDGRNRVEAPL